MKRTSPTGTTLGQFPVIKSTQMAHSMVSVEFARNFFYFGRGRTGRTEGTEGRDGRRAAAGATAEAAA